MDVTKKLEAFGNRSRTNYSNGVLTIEILDVTKEDIGNYRLEVMYDNHLSSNCWIEANGTIMLRLNGKILIF